MVLNGLLLAAGFALLRYTRRSRLLAEAQMQFVTNVSHELRTPLTVIRGAAHNLLTGLVKDSGKVEGYARLIAHHAEELLSMMEQVLSLSSARKKRGMTPARTGDVSDIIARAVAATGEETKGCTVDVHIAWLRQKLEDNPQVPRYILTVRGEGYRFKP